MKPSLDMYKEIGVEFKNLGPRMTHDLVDLSNIFGVRAVEDLNKALNAFDKVKSKLDDLIYEDYPELDGQKSCRVFYDHPTEEHARIPIKKHTKLTLEEYTAIGNEVKEIESLYMELAVKACKLHGKTAIRGMLDAQHKFWALRNTLERVMCKDLKGTPLNSMTDVFY